MDRNSDAYACRAGERRKVGGAAVSGATTVAGAEDDTSSGLKGILGKCCVGPSGVNTVVVRLISEMDCLASKHGSAPGVDDGKSLSATDDLDRGGSSAATGAGFTLISIG